MRLRTVAGSFFCPQSNTTPKFSVSLARAAFMALLLLVASSSFAQTTVTLADGTSRALVMRWQTSKWLLADYPFGSRRGR